MIMMRGMMKRASLLAVALSASLFGADVRPLPEVPRTGGLPLMEALSRRQSQRDFTEGATLTEAELAGVLWAANGFNRDGKRTAPSAMNAQAVDIYVFDAAGAWRYEPTASRLTLVRAGDLRGETGGQPFVRKAAVNLVFVYDTARAPRKGDSRWAAVDAAFCAENVYLYCASAGLKTVVRGSVSQEQVAKALGLPETARAVLAQSVGK